MTYRWFLFKNNLTNNWCIWGNKYACGDRRILQKKGRSASWVMMTNNNLNEYLQILKTECIKYSEGTGAIPIMIHEPLTKWALWVCVLWMCLGIFHVLKIVAPDGQSRNQSPSGPSPSNGKLSSWLQIGLLRITAVDLPLLWRKQSLSVIDNDVKRLCEMSCEEISPSQAKQKERERAARPGRAWPPGLRFLVCLSVCLSCWGAVPNPVNLIWDLGSGIWDLGSGIFVRRISSADFFSRNFFLNPPNSADLSGSAEKQRIHKGDWIRNYWNY